MTAQILKPFRCPIPTGEPVKQVIDGLRELLEKAERGEIVGMVAVVADPAGAMLSVSFSGESSRFGLLGGVRLLERDMIQEWWP